MIKLFLVDYQGITETFYLASNSHVVIRQDQGYRDEYFEVDSIVQVFDSWVNHEDSRQGTAVWFEPKGTLLFLAYLYKTGWKPVGCIGENRLRDDFYCRESVTYKKDNKYLDIKEMYAIWEIGQSPDLYTLINLRVL